MEADPETGLLIFVPISFETLEPPAPPQRKDDEKDDDDGDVPEVEGDSASDSE
jgi:hypothetical protein